LSVSDEAGLRLVLKKFAVFDDKFLSPIIFQIRQLGQVIQASQAYSVMPCILAKAKRHINYNISSNKCTEYLELIQEMIGHRSESDRVLQLRDSASLALGALIPSSHIARFLDLRMKTKIIKRNSIRL
jgi:hypothetical protein